MPSKKQENFFSKTIRTVDLLGLTPQFLIERKHKYNTISGGMLSILIYILSILSCFFFGKELYLKADPTVILSNSFDKEPRLFNLTAENFNFFVGVQGIDFLYYIDPTIFTLKIGFNQITSNESPSGEVQFKYDYNRFEFERCSLNKHFKNFKHIFETQDLENLLCINQENSEFKSLPLVGTFGEKNYQYVEFTVSTCKNGTTPGVVCKPKEVIDKKLEGGYFVLNYIETIFDPKNFTNPEIRVRRDFYTSMSNKYFKEITFWMKNVDYISDEGILMSSEQTKNYLQTDNIREIYDFRTGAETFVSAVLRLSYNRDVVKRRYLRLQDVIAQVGGFIKGIMLVVAFFNYFYSTTNFYIFLMNKLYAFDSLLFNYNGNCNDGGNFSNINNGMNSVCFVSDKAFEYAKNQKLNNAFSRYKNQFSTEQNKKQMVGKNEENIDCRLASVNNNNYNNSEINQIKQIEENRNDSTSCEIKNINLNSNANSNKIIKRKKSEVFNLRNFKKNKAAQQPRIETEENCFKSIENAKENDEDKSSENKAVKYELSKHLNLQADSNLNTINNIHREATLNVNNFEFDNQVAHNEDIIQVDCSSKLKKVVSADMTMNKDGNISKYKNKNNNNKNNQEIRNDAKNLVTLELEKPKNKVTYTNVNNANEINNNKTIIKKNLDSENNESQENTQLEEIHVVSQKISRHPEEILTRINTQHASHKEIKYNFLEKLKLMFGLCFGMQNGKEYDSKKTLKQQKQFIFEKSYLEITEKFDAFKYLKIFDDVELIKNILFTVDQINVLDIISKARHKYKIQEETPVHLQHKSLRNIGESNDEINMKIKMILKNTHLL